MSNSPNEPAMPRQARAATTATGQRLFLSAAVIALVCAGGRPAGAQSVTGAGDLTGGAISAPSWTIGTDIRVGDSGTGTLDIENGGTVSSGGGSDAAFVGNQAGSNGSVTVSGTDGSGHASAWTNNDDLVIGQDGTGTMNIANGGKVSNGAGYIGAGGDPATVFSTVIVSGSSGDGLVSTWLNSGDLNVGDAGNGTLKILGGGTVSNAIGSVGNQTGGIGAVLISGNDGNGHTSTWTSSGQIYIGNAGTGTLTVQDGGKAISDQGLIGYGAGSNGTVTVTGTDGNGHGSSWTPENNIYAGVSGTGALNIVDGGAVSTSATGGGAATLYIGYSSGGAGTVSISSATAAISILTTTDRVEIGESGAGTLTIEKGGRVSAGSDTYIAINSTATGTLNLLGDASGRGVLETGSVISGSGAGIFNFNGGILRATRDEGDFLNGFAALTIGPEGGWFDTNGHTISVSTGFSGSGLTKQGAGALILTGASSYTGGTAITAGTLQLGDGGITGSITGDVTDNGTLAFKRSDNMAFGGTISGSGAVTQTGMGTTALTAANTYTGGTAISAGTLTGSATSFGSGAITNNAVLVIDQPADAGFTNAINGTGAFTKQGAGRLNYTGTGTLSGPTTVAAGLLSVNGSLANSAVTVQSGATLGGNGTVGAAAILAGGTIAPGNSLGTLHINGAYHQAGGSVYQVQVDPNTNASDLIAVNGAATLASGADLAVSKVVPGDYRTGTVYTVLTAANGVTGTYMLSGDTVISPYLGLRDSYDANNVYLTVAQTGDPAGTAVTSNQTQTATGTGSLPDTDSVASAVLNTPDAGTTRSAFDQLSGEALASAKSALISDSLLLRDTAFGRLRDLFCATDDSRGPDRRSRNACPLRPDRPAAWVQGFGNWGHIGGDGNAAALSQSSGGFLVGMDIPVRGWRLGYFGGFSRTDFTVKARNASGNSNNYHLGAYGGTQWGGLGLRLGASYSWNDLATGRSVTVSALHNDLHASYDAGTMQVFGELGWHFDFGRLALEPFANLAYVNLHTSGFHETGGDAALTAKADTMEDGFTTIGMRPSADLSWGGFNATVHGMAGWRHVLGDVSPRSTVSFAGSDTFTVTGAAIARDAVVVAAGLDFMVGDDLFAGITYSGQFGRRETDHGVRGNLTVTL